MPNTPKRVIVVDDERNIADTLVLILKAQGFEAIAAYSGPAAVTAALQFKPDVAILDVVMGSMSGIDAGVLISQQIPACSILLFSGQVAAGAMLNRARLDGYAFPVFAKPVHPQIFLDLLNAPPPPAVVSNGQPN